MAARPAAHKEVDMDQEPAGKAFLPAAVRGETKGFSLWVFEFNYPNLCSKSCDVDDIGTATPGPGAERGGV
jgi:hypothetical protein